jgi:hypothetical protein
MNIEQALKVFNPDNQKQPLPQQREAYQTLKQGIEDMQRDLDLATGNYTPTDDIINGLRHAADDHPCCKKTLQSAADVINRLSIASTDAYDDQTEKK